jgi:uncharacterized protein
VAGLKSFVARRAEELTGLNVSWFGGEPLLATDVIHDLSASFARECGQRGIPYTSNITTNGYLLTRDVAHSLIQDRVTQFQVTFDGCESTHDKTRITAGGGKTYRRILGNLAEMRTLPDEFRVTVRVNFNPESIPLVSAFLAETSSLFANDDRFCMYFRPIGKWGGPHDSEMQTCDLEQAAMAKAEFLEEHVTYGFPAHFTKQTLQCHGMVCYAAKESSIVVGADGTLYKCTLGFTDPKNQVGNLTEDGQLIVDPGRWRAWVTVDGLDTSGCTECPLVPLCQSRACPREAMIRKRAVCPVTKLEYESSVKAVAAARSPEPSQRV